MVPNVASGASAFAPATIRASFGGCGAVHRVLAFQSLFAAFDPKPLSPSPHDWVVCARVGGDAIASHDAAACGRDALQGLPWLDQRALPALLNPSAEIERLVRRLSAEMMTPDGARDPTLDSQPTWPTA